MTDNQIEALVTAIVWAGENVRQGIELKGVKLEEGESVPQPDWDIVNQTVGMILDLCDIKTSS